MKRLLRIGSMECVIVPWYQTPPGRYPPRPVAHFFAKQFLSGFMNDLINRQTLREFLRSEFGDDCSRMNDHEVVDCLARYMIDKRFQIVLPATSPFSPESPGFTRRLGYKEKREKRVPVTTGPTAWIKIKVVDDETGEPVSGVMLTIKKTDSKMTTRNTRADGTIEIDQMISGSCELSCDLEGASLEDTLACVSVGD